MVDVKDGAEQWQTQVTVLLVKSYSEIIDSLLQQMLRQPDCDSEEKMRIGHMNLMNTAAIAAIHAAAN